MMQLNTSFKDQQEHSTIKLFVFLFYLIINISLSEPPINLGFQPHVFVPPQYFHVSFFFFFFSTSLLMGVYSYNVLRNMDLSKVKVITDN